MMNFSVYPVVALEMAKELLLSNTQVGFLMFIYGIFYAIAQIPAGAVADRFGGSKLASLSVTAFGCVGVLFALSPNYSWAVLTRVLLGFSSGFFLPATMRLLPRWFTTREYDQAMGVFGAGQGLALTLTFLSVPLVALTLGWRAGLLSVSGLTLLCAVLSWSVVREARGARHQPSERVPFRLNRVITKQLIILTSFNFSTLAVFSGIVTWAPKFLTDLVHLPLIQVGYVTAIIGVMNMAGSYFGGLFSKKGHGAWVVAISMIICVVSPPLLFYAQAPLAALAVIALVGWGTMFYFAPTFGGIPSAVAPEYTGLGFGILNTISFVGSSITPLIGGVILDLTSRFDLAFLSISTIALFGLVCSSRFKTNNR